MADPSHAQRLTALDASSAARLIAAGDISSVELTQACLDRIDRRDGQVRAWRRAPAAAALEQARACDATDPVGPLHGVPFGVKDLIDTAGLDTEYGSPIHAGHRPAVDATCVQRLQRAGGVMLGKTVTTEFAFFHPGPTANPHDLGRTPGGSSSGSAAAVADLHVPLALGTQTAGSVVRPASFCGVWGMKPTFDAIPVTGTRAASPSLDTLGVLARSAADLALGVGVLAGATPDPSGPAPNVAFVRTHEWDRAEPTTRDAVASLAADLGLDEVVLPEHFAGLLAAQTTIMEVEALVALAPEFADHRDQLSDQLRAALERAATIDPGQVDAARALADRCRADLDEVFGDHDVLLAPAVLGEAPVGLVATGDPLLCRIWTLLGTPAVAVPGLLGPAGMPLGVQVVARPHDDGAALAAAIRIGAHLGGTVAPPDRLVDLAGGEVHHPGAAPDPTSTGASPPDPTFQGRPA